MGSMVPVPPCFNPCFPGCCSETGWCFPRAGVLKLVSILVFLDVALRLRDRVVVADPLGVSILVFLDVALRQRFLHMSAPPCNVSILVFLDVALRPGLKGGASGT